MTQVQTQRMVVCEGCGRTMHQCIVNSRNNKGRFYETLPVKYCIKCKCILVLNDMVVKRI